jgi:hypothetical protein
MGTPEIRAGRTFVPVRFVADAMGGNIHWNAATAFFCMLLQRGRNVYFFVKPKSRTSSNPLPWKNLNAIIITI